MAVSGPAMHPSHGHAWFCTLLLGGTQHDITEYRQRAPAPVTVIQHLLIMDLAGTPLLMGKCFTYL